MECIAVIIPTHNNQVRLVRCLRHLDSNTWRAFVAIVVVDGCTDDTADRVQAEFPNAVILHGNGNLYWSGSANLGIEYALAQREFTHIQVFNEDQYMEKNYLASQVDLSHQMPDAILGLKGFRYGSNELYIAGRVMDRWAGSVPAWYHSGIEALSDKPYEVDMLDSGGFFRREILMKIHDEYGYYYDPFFKISYADTDICLRAAKLGFRSVINPKAIVWTEPADTARHVEVKRAQRSLLAYYLFDVRSWYNLHQKMRFHIRHGPPTWPLILLRQYAGLFQRWFAVRVIKGDRQTDFLRRA